jgi:transcriptional regulator with XRE-family HTH domain
MNTIQLLRSALRLSQVEFSDLLGISKGQLAMAEIGKRPLPSDAQARLALLEHLLEGFQPPAEETLSETEQNEFRKYRDLLKARITGLEETIEKRKATRMAALRCIYLQESLQASPLVPENDISKDRMTIAARKAKAWLESDENTSIPKLQNQLMGLQHELSCAEVTLK